MKITLVFLLSAICLTIVDAETQTNTPADQVKAWSKTAKTTISGFGGIKAFQSAVIGAGPALLNPMYGVSGFAAYYYLDDAGIKACYTLWLLGWLLFTRMPPKQIGLCVIALSVCVYFVSATLS